MSIHPADQPSAFCIGSDISYAYNREVRIAQSRGPATLDAWLSVVDCMATYVHQIVRLVPLSI